MTSTANKGFSIGISDVTPGAALRAQKDKLVTEAYLESNDLIHKARTGSLENQPGSNVDETLESMISGTLSRVRDKVGEICMTELSRNNSPLIMATCGSKGLSSLPADVLEILKPFRASRIQDQCISDGRLCRTTNYCWKSCT